MATFHSILEAFLKIFGDHVVFSAGLLLLIGHFLGELAEKIKLPSITGYIITGLVLGGHFLGIVPHEMAHKLTTITEIALGLIALTIGGEFSFSKLKRYGSKILILTMFEALFALVFVSLIMVSLGMDFRYALILGAISTATAPAATVIVIRKLRARGEFIDHLYGIVAFDDAACVVIFSIIFAIIAPMLSGVAAESSGVFHNVLHAFEHILFSIILGFVSGFILNFLVKKKYIKNEILIISLSIIFITTAAAIALELSLLITNMSLGVALINLSNKNKKIFSVLEPLTPPIFALFFILAGTELNISVFTDIKIVMFGIVYIVSRFLGKYSGIYLGSIVTKSNTQIKKFLGFCLFPQAGVAIGLILLVQTSPILSTAPENVQTLVTQLVNIILLSIVINEIVGPAISKYGIVKGSKL